MSWEEIDLYSDAHVAGEIVGETAQPFEVLNAIGGGPAANARPVLVLRVHHRARREGERLVGAETDTSSYHGGSAAAEVAALLSLKLGIRLHVGPTTRYGGPGTPDRPVRKESGTAPPFFRSADAILPSHVASRTLSPRELEWYPHLCASDAVAVARAARMYQEAVWNAESDANVAWLQLVGAAEVAAVQWRASNHEEPSALLRSLKPRWAEQLQAAGGEKLVADMAAEWAHLLAATKRFVEFLLSHLPEPPHVRPPHNIVDWTPSPMKASLKQVYELRSSALHGGEPFPLPMCQAPTVGHPVAVERPTGIAASAAGATWLAEDMPMHLHIFEYIVRGALLRWIDSLRPDGAAS